MLKKRQKKIKKLIKTGKYDADVAKYIPGTLEMVYRAMLEDIDTREKVHGTVTMSTLTGCTSVSL